MQDRKPVSITIVLGNMHQAHNQFRTTKVVPLPFPLNDTKMQSLLYHCLKERAPPWTRVTHVTSIAQHVTRDVRSGTETERDLSRGQSDGFSTVTNNTVLTSDHSINKIHSPMHQHVQSSSGMSAKPLCNSSIAHAQFYRMTSHVSRNPRVSRSINNNSLYTTHNTQGSFIIDLFPKSKKFYAHILCGFYDT